jgi:hypothetical protein
MPLSFEPAVPGPIGGALEGTQLAGLAAERGTEAINDHERRSPDRGTNRSGPKGCSGKVLGLIRLPSVPLLGALSVKLPGTVCACSGSAHPRRTPRMICGAFGSTRLAASSSGSRTR